MALLTLSQISKSYGAETILTDISLQLQPAEKAGLIGPNGSGKTTLLKIIAAEIEADDGTLHLARGAKIGYLSQEPPVIPAGTLRSHLEHPLRHIYDLRKEISALEEEIAVSAESKKPPLDLEESLERYASLTASFEEEGGYQVDSRLAGVARGLGFAEADFGRDISDFSGGEKTRARLAGLLLQDHDLLLLDEPTNFLDLSALEWLEKYLRDLTCALIVVSHDRFFLDRVVSRIFALQGGKGKLYSGNYSDYQRQLEMQDLSAQRDYQRLQLLKEREERLVREAKSDQRSKRQARSRQKRLDKLEPVERRDREQSFKLGLGYTGRSGRQVIIFEKIDKKFETKTIFNDLSFEIRWGDRIALIGPNGAGKTTLLKLVSGELKPTAGKIRLGPSVSVLYFDQEQEQLVTNQTLLETITSASDFDIKQARNHLGRYLFRGDDVFKQVSDLSGGEKSRLALARLALSSGNCLLMDEPTSHLDLPAMEKLENVLKDYPGTLIIVSHDRYFLKGLANRVFELDSGNLRIYDRSFEEYLELKESGGIRPGKVKEDKEEEKRKRQEEHRLRQAGQRTERRLRDEQAGLEKKISETEEEIARLEKLLSDPGQYGDYNRLAELGFALETAKTGLTTLMQQWEEATSRLETLQ
ncbi:MAG: ABC-F family ATP-binding cassette domain-containing protein [Bacillota bacterium]